MDSSASLMIEFIHPVGFNNLYFDFSIRIYGNKIVDIKKKKKKRFRYSIGEEEKMNGKNKI